MLREAPTGTSLTTENLIVEKLLSEEEGLDVGYELPLDRDGRQGAQPCRDGVGQLDRSLPPWRPGLRDPCALTCRKLQSANGSKQGHRSGAIEWSPRGGGRVVSSPWIRVRVCGACSGGLYETLRAAAADSNLPVCVERVECLHVCGFRPRADVILPGGEWIRYGKDDYDSGGAEFHAVGDDPVATLILEHLQRIAGSSVAGS